MTLTAAPRETWTDDRSRIRGSLARVRRVTGADLAIYGRVQPGDGLRLTDFDGHVVGPIRGARVEPGHGVGGHVLRHRCPLALHDYVRSPLIVHTYDHIVRAERLRSVVAAPVIVGRDPVAVLYASSRTPHAGADRLLHAVVQEARALEQSLAVADVIRHQQESWSPSEEGRWRTRVQAAYAELRAIAPSVTDRDLRARLTGIVEGLSLDAGNAPAGVRLTAREQDVLALIAGGLPNRSIGERLGIGLYTVKGHVKNLMGKLAAETRFELVVNARRAGLLP